MEYNIKNMEEILGTYPGKKKLLFENKKTES